ncbi:MAG TPA: glycoside hydrolase family 57 protein [Candidatus Deferrimicrobium sp.]|nr:glycoside hydrolase family 57 protein [Candidatus Deferrimicrobium sp.]
MGHDTPLKVAILWHMHQPNYREPDSKRLVLPWVRLHATKDYLDMPLTVAEFEGVKVTFNLVPSLLDQFQLYVDGGTDRHLELSIVRAEDLNEDCKREILDTFFAAHFPTMIEPHARYHELYLKKKKNVGDPILPALFASGEMRDLQVWSNLVWVDPMFRSEEPIKSLFSKGRYFTEAEKLALLQWQRALIARIVPTYRELFDQGRIDISFTPYYHPILPLLCDTDSALEAVPGITLPGRGFRHPEDAERQIVRSMELFETFFGRALSGMWPSEGAISQEAADLLARLGLKWTATDEDILYYSLKKSNVEPAGQSPYMVYEYGPGLKIFFRDHTLSDRIGFVYSGWDADKAVADFMSQLKKVRTMMADRLDDTVVTIILDGENAWEYFPNDGRDFLTLFYRQLADDAAIETVTLTEAAARVAATPLPKVFAGSWINHNFRIWIGHREDNAAWDALLRARETLARFVQEHPDYDREKVAAAWEQIYVAEGSDWCWWYGDEHRGSRNIEFDRIFRRHLAAVYLSLGLEVPSHLLTPIYESAGLPGIVHPEVLLTPVLDGRLTHYYEWDGAGRVDCNSVGGAMHRASRYLSKICFAYDLERVYIRVDFVDSGVRKRSERMRLLLTLLTPQAEAMRVYVDAGVTSGREQGKYQYRLDEILELAIERAALWPERHGSIEFTVAILDGDRTVEVQPELEPIRFEVFAQNNELFWPSW